MAVERVTVGRGNDGDKRDTCWLDLDGKCLWSGFPRESIAQAKADRLNAAFDKTAHDARIDERKQCIHALEEVLSAETPRYRNPGMEHAIAVLKRSQR